MSERTPQEWATWWASQESPYTGLRYRNQLVKAFMSGWNGALALPNRSNFGKGIRRAFQAGKDYRAAYGASPEQEKR